MFGFRTMTDFHPEKNIGTKYPLSMLNVSLIVLVADF